jgi:XTP/dITP diphosphohydrolase
MSFSRVLVLGTANRKKGAELVELLAPLGLTLKTLADFPQALDVEETGDSFRANATLKAFQQARHLHAWVLGEDSGLSVDALDGAPGIFSARYAAAKATDEQNNARLLEQMANVPEPRRTAHYVCHLVLSDPSGAVRAESAGTCQGRIRREPAGSAGFGYDPLFEIPEYHRTFGQLGENVKAVLSHRSRAIEHLLPQLVALRDEGAFEAGGKSP